MKKLHLKKCKIAAKMDGTTGVRGSLSVHYDGKCRYIHFWLFGLCALYLDKVAYCNYIGNTPFWSASTIPYHLILSAPIELIYFANYPFLFFVWLQTTDRRFWYAPLELIVCVKIATDGDSHHSDPTTTSLIISYHNPHCLLFLGISRVMIHG